MSDTVITDPKKIGEVFKLMVEHKIQSFKAGDIEIKRESLALQQAEDSKMFELEQTKRAYAKG